jgi:hypothetical protein
MVDRKFSVKFNDFSSLQKFLFSLYARQKTFCQNQILILDNRQFYAIVRLTKTKISMKEYILFN